MENERTAAVTAQAENDIALPAFDYSGLDTATADSLHEINNRVLMLRQTYVIGLAQAVADAHALLASHYGGLFGGWCESIGISRQSAQNLLRVVKIFDNSTEEEQQILAHAQPSLLYAAAKPCAPAEAVAAVKSGDITTHKEYQDLLAKLKNAERKAHDAETGKTMAQQSLNQALYERSTAQNLLQNTKSRLEKTQDELSAAQSELAALKKRPIEVAVEKPDPAEIDRLAGEKAEALTADLRGQLKTANEECDTLRRLADNAADPNEDYDTLLLALRAISNMWQSVAIPFQRLPLKMRKGIKEQVVEAMQGILDDARLYCEANPREETA